MSNMTAGEAFLALKTQAAMLAVAASLVEEAADAVASDYENPQVAVNDEDNGAIVTILEKTTLAGIE